MWISFIHLPLISCVHEFMCWVEVWDPENFILLSKDVIWSLSSLRWSMCQRKRFIRRIPTWIVSSVGPQKRGRKCPGLLWSTLELSSSCLLTSSWMLLCGWRVCLSHPLHVETMPPLIITSCMCDSERVWHTDCNEDEMLSFLPLLMSLFMLLMVFM